MLAVAFFLWVGLLLQSGDPGARSDSYRQKAEDLFDQERYEESLVLYRKAFDEIKDTDKVRAANLCNDISSVYYSLQQFDRSVDACRQGLSLLQRSSQRPDSVYFKLYSSLGTMFHRKAQPDSSNYYFLLSDQLLKDNEVIATQIPEYVLHHYLNQGRAVWRKYRYYESIEYFKKALALCQETGMDSELFYIYSSLAEVFDLLGQHEEALKWRLSAIKEVPASRVQSRLSLYSGLGNTYLHLNQRDSALVWLNKSLNLLDASSKLTENQKAQHLYVLTGLAAIHLHKGDPRSARNLLSRASKLYLKETLNRPALRSHVFLSLGEYENYLGNSEAALRYFDSAYRQLLSDSLGTENGAAVRFPKYAIKALMAKADIYSERYKKNRNTPDLKRAFELYGRLVKLKKETYKEVASSLDDRFLFSGSNQLMMEKAVLNGFEYYQKHPTPENLELLFNRFEDANTAFLMDRISQSTDQPHEDFVPDHLRLQDVQNKIDQRCVYVSYKLIGDKMLAFILTQKSAEVKSWTIRPSLFDSHLNALLQEVKINPGLGVYKGSKDAQYCYNTLIKPIEKELSPYKRWAIVRDWRFASLPFELLENEANKYIGDQKRISYAYSAYMFWFHPLLKEEKMKTRDAFVFAPFIRGKNLSGKIDGWKAVSTLEEVVKMGQEYLIGNDATKQRFKEIAANHYILNLATHAFADLNNPNSSYVQFYPGIDSKLYLDEIINMEFSKTRLILLSSCFGNEGASVAGEGIVSLAYAFAQAGCPTLITSNWEANENTTGFLTSRISHYIDKGYPLDKAVQIARLDLRNDVKFDKYDHPYFWGNISIIGNYSALYEPADDPSRNTYLITLISLILLTGVFLTARYLRSGLRK